MELVQNIYLGRDNVSNLKFTYVDGSGVQSDLNLSGLSSAAIIIHGGKNGADVTANSANGVNMTWDSEGNFKAYLGDIDLDVGSYPATIIFFDTNHTDGQIVISRNGERKLTYRVIND